MSSPYDWRVGYKCACGEYRFPFRGRKHFLDEVCGECGRSKETFTRVVARWVDTVVIWKPSTWFTGHYEEREKQ